jgi:hypothetical protein
MPGWMGDWTGALLLGTWALTVGMAALAAGMGAWGYGFVRGVRWERSKHQAWLGRERRKEQKPVPVERRAGHRAPDTAPDMAKAPTPEE